MSESGAVARKRWRGYGLQLGAALGIAVAAVHLRLPPGGTVETLPGGVVATPGDRWFLLVVLVLLWALVPPLARRFGRQRVEIVLAGLTGLLAVVPGHSLWFRCPLLAVSAASAAITCWRLGRLQGSGDDAAGSDLTRASGAAGQRRAGAIVSALVLLAGVALAAIAPGAQGDEPHYLLVAHSIWQDGDIDLADDYADREDLAFHRGAISPHYKAGLTDGSRYSMHGLGYPALLLPVYAAARSTGLWSPVLGARLMQVAMLALVAWLLVGYLGKRIDGWAGPAAVLMVLGLAPVIFAPVNLFPETPAMLLSLVAYLSISRSRSTAAELGGGAALALLPWLGGKYIPLALATGVGALFASDSRPNLVRGLRALAPLALALVLHGLFTWTLYGSWSPSAIYLGADPSVGRQPGYGADWAAYLADWPGAVRTFVGYFFDQKEGLFLLAPQMLLVAAGIPWIWRHRRREGLALAFILLAHLGPYALSQQIGGQSPPARPLMAVLWTMSLPLAGALAAPLSRWAAVVRGALPVLGVAITGALAWDMRLLPHDYPVTESRLLRALSAQGAELWTAFPLWLNLRGNAQWVPTTIWTLTLVALLAGLVWAARARRNGTPDAPDAALFQGAAIAWVLVAAVAAHSASLVLTERHVGAEIAEGVEAWVVSAVPESAWAEPGGVWIAAGPPREIVFVIDPAASPMRDDTLSIRLRTLTDSRVVLGSAGSWWGETIAAGAPIAHELRLGWPHRWNGRAAYRVLLGADRGIEPAQLDGGGDWRPLGVFLQIAREPEQGGQP